MELLSITIVAYKNYNDIKKAISTIEQYTTIPCKIYVVDNGNSEMDDDDVHDFKAFLRQFEEITYIDSEGNIGFGAGHNKVLPIINSKYHAIVNPDVILKDDVFSSIIEYMENTENVGMVIPRIVDENGELQKVYRKELTVFDMFIRMFCSGLFKRRQAKHTLQDKDYTKTFQVPFGQGSFLVIRTELFRELEGFDDGFFMYIEDADLCKRVNQKTRLMYFPGAEVIHKWEKGSHKSKTLFKYHLNSMLYYFKKWGIKIL